MHLNCRNVNDAFARLVGGIHDGQIATVRQPSRAGDVLMVPEPVTVTYHQPRQRVLFNTARDANPFFHLYESLWMLVGRNDVAPLAYYNSQIANIASDDGKTFNGAYGFRWRFGKRHVRPGHNNMVAEYDDVDQLKVLINHLSGNPLSRRAVLQMWGVEDDLLKIDETKDVCCNTCVYFSVRVCQTHAGCPLCPECKLDMTVCNRSNDLIWGMLGANVVHFSFLQEYVACALGIEVGVYNQFTNNLHVYTERWKPEEWLSQFCTYPYSQDWCGIHLFSKMLFGGTSLFDKLCYSLVDVNKSSALESWNSCEWGNEFLDTVAQPMCSAFHLHKRRDYSGALRCVDKIQSEDWRRAAKQWIEKRKAKREGRGNEQKTQ